MSLNDVYGYTPRDTAERAVPSGTLPGTPLIINSRPAVAITARADATKTFTLADGSTRTVPIGNPWQTAGTATVAFGGTFEFKGITGVTTSTGQDVAIYITSGGALTTTSTANTLFGYTNYPTSYTKATGQAAVRIAGNNNG
jgi:hypothetical protein